MKIRVGFSVFLISSVLSVSYVYAVSPKKAPDFERLAADIHVTGEQMEQFLSIMKAQHQQRRSIHKEGRAQAKARMDALRGETLVKLSTVLSPSQMTLLEERMEKRQQERERFRMLNAQDACCYRKN